MTPAAVPDEMSGAEPPIVYVVDDDRRVREALRALISSAGFRVALFGSAGDFVEADWLDAPACLVLDLRLPDGNGLDLQAELVRLHGPPIVFISGRGDIPTSVRAMKAGAIEFLPKPFKDTDLLQAIASAIAKDKIARVKREELADLERAYRGLTPREREVLPLVTAGLANKVTARRLGVSEITVGVHRGRIMRKMHARSFADLVRMADKLGVDREGLSS